MVFVGAMICHGKKFVRNVCKGSVGWGQKVSLSKFCNEHFARAVFAGAKFYSE